MKIAIIGYGKMGKELERMAISRGHEIVCKIDVDNTDEFVGEAFRSADVALEFSSPSSAYGNVIKAFEAGVKVVSGTTGWFPEHKYEMAELCRKGNTLFWSSNFSIGVAIFSAVNKYLASIMNRFVGYDVSIEETHHIHKLDAPSGTALSLATVIREEIARVDDIEIKSIREGENPGVHTVHYNGIVDSITISHAAKSRSGFAMGAIMAAEYTVSHEGLLGMKDFLNL